MLGLAFGFMLGLLDCNASDRVAGWQCATDPQARDWHLLANYASSLGNGKWRFNQTRVSERQMLEYVRQASDLNPRPRLVVDFSRVATAAERRRLKIAIGRAMRCDSEDGVPCIEGTKREYASAR